MADAVLSHAFQERKNNREIKFLSRADVASLIRKLGGTPAGPLAAADQPAATHQRSLRGVGGGKHKLALQDKAAKQFSTGVSLALLL